MDFLYKDIIYSFSLYELLWYFLIYAFLGWCMEVCYAAFKTHKFVNRGFLIGTYCPLYGAGACAVLVLLDPVKNHPFLVFLLSALITTSIELVTGIVLELLYHKKWWDYSKRRFNFKGYICLEFTVIWGICCLLVYDLIHPLVRWPISHIPHKVGIWLLLLWIIDFICDVIISTIQATKFAKYVTRAKEYYKKGSDIVGSKLAGATIKLVDATSESKKKLDMKKSTKRLIKAFPSMKDKNDEGIITKLRLLALRKKQDKFIEDVKKIKKDE